MKIRTKLALLLTLGVLVPLGLSLHFVARRVKQTMTRMLEQELAAEVSQTAGRINDRLIWAAEGLGLVVQSVPFESFTQDELRQSLALPYRQLSDTTLVALLDDSGKALTASYRPDATEAALLKRATVSDADLEEFAKNVPLELALTAHVAFGPPYRSDMGEPRMVAASSFAVFGSERRWVLAVELSLRALCDDAIGSKVGADGRVRRLLDNKGNSICDPSSLPWRATDDARDTLALAPRAIAKKNVAGRAVLSTSDEVALTGWRLEVRQAEDVVMAPVSRLTTWTLIWAGVALALALLGGLLLARGLTVPISELEQASKEVAGGAYDRVLPVRSEDEVGSLARTFNRMTAEIRAWNAELTKRVEQRTHELKEAQAQILQSQKLAAVGELGAGVAHEINNPLTGVLGLSQLLRAEAAPGTELAETLDDIIANARRVAEVVDALLRFSQTQVSPDMGAVEPGRVLEEIVSMYAGRIAEKGVAIGWDFEEACSVNAVEGDLRIALTHLVDNAVRAMPQGGHLGLGVAHVEGGAVRVSISDDGAGMPEEVRLRAADPFFSTRPPGSGSKGLGLWIVHRVVEDHGGKIVLESVVGHGTTATLYFPGKVRLSKA
jgi:two-component system, NtrC family, sensor kinase